MKDRKLLPPMGALHCFVAAARHGNFSRAGEEIGLTQSAVSRQIALLEDWLGASLFHRAGRRVRLSAAGQAYLDELAPALERIARASAAARAPAGPRELSIATLPSFGMRWLAPRLGSLSERHPGLIVNFTARAQPFDLAAERFDAAIHYGRADWPGAEHVFLFREQAIAVCAPALADRHAAADPAQLADWPLLYQALRPSAWADWLRGQGQTVRLRPGGAVFDQFLMMAQAAVAGAGIALIPRFLIEPELAAGTLVSPFAHVLETDQAYYLVHRRGDPGPALRPFIAWLVAEAVADQQQQPASLLP